MAYDYVILDLAPLRFVPIPSQVDLLLDPTCTGPLKPLPVKGFTERPFYLLLGFCELVDEVLVFQSLTLCPGRCKALRLRRVTGLYY